MSKNTKSNKSKTINFWKWQLGFFIRKINFNHNCLNQVMEGDFYCEVCNPQHD